MLEHYEYQSDFARRFYAEGVQDGIRKSFEAGFEEGFEKGFKKGMARALLAVLRSRRLSIDAAVAQRIADCHDLARLERWIERAAVVSSIEDVFVD